MEVLLFPYLPLRARCTVGLWELIPRDSLAIADCVSEEMVGHAGGVAALYRLPSDGAGYGAFVRRTDLCVGDETEDNLSTLRNAVGVALLDLNPSRADAEEEPANAARAMCTTENSLLFGHRFGDDLHTAYETGTMVRMLHGGPRVGQDVDLIQPPNDLMLPLIRPRFDVVYANALHQVLAEPADEAADLAGAIRWLTLAWSNNASFDEPGRILALRAGYDVLFGGANTRTIRAQLSALLEEAGAVATHREWDDHAAHREEDLTDLEWWFQSFALLRNKIAHGGTIPPEEFLFEGAAPHVWHAERNLRRAIKQTVANAGHEDVLLSEMERITRRAAALILEDVAAELEAEGQAADEDPEAR